MGNIKYKDSKTGDKVQSSSWMFAGYGSYNLDSNWFVRGALIAGSNAITSKEKRNSVRGNLTATGKYNIESYSVDAAVGYNYRMAGATLTPTLGLRATYLSDIDYDETGAGAQNRKVTQKSNISTSVIGGLQYTTNAMINDMLVTA
ncbi:MAG UNVERIFIED_CONTAM: autotransporter outer membrane beta-barrel domain-containing protein [Rickettsiaceae bacterium]